MADRKTFEHLSYRVATRRQSFNLPNMISITARQCIAYSIDYLRPTNGIAPDGKPMRLIPLTEDARPMILGITTGSGEDQTQLRKAFTAHAKSRIELHADSLLGNHSDAG